MADVNFTPTADLYGQLQSLADHFNRELFAGKLPAMIITLQRSPRCAGHFAASRWRHVEGEAVSELALNPSFFATRPLIALCQTIVHELCHLWQHVEGTASRAGYHNAIWADKMAELGLQATATGRPGGARTGQRITDYPIRGGRFLKACDDLVTKGFALTWVDQGQRSPVVHRSDADSALDLAGIVTDQLLVPLASLFPDLEDDEFAKGIARQKRKAQYRCPKCKARVWGKHGLAITCRRCDRDFETVTTTDPDGLIVADCDAVDEPP